MSRKCTKSTRKKKKRAYNDRVLQIERGSFTPLVFCTNGGKGRECRKFFQRLGQNIAEKRGISYNLVANWINRKISFALNKCIIVCIRGSRCIKEMNPLSNEIDISEKISST